MKPDYKKIYNFVVEKYKKSKHFAHGPFDETYYTLRVYEIAKEIIKRLDKKVDKEKVLVAAILHDIGKVKLNISKLFDRKGELSSKKEEWNKHPLLGLPIARNFLKKNGYSKDFIEYVCYLIANHDLRGNKMKNRTLELKILQDADLIADIGLSGFIRPLLYTGKFYSQSTIEAFKYIAKEDRTNNGDLINLKVSKELLKEKILIQRKLVKMALKNIKSDLI